MKKPSESLSDSNAVFAVFRICNKFESVFHKNIDDLTRIRRKIKQVILILAVHLSVSPSAYPLQINIEI
jgi:hypothetical protein